MEIQGIEEQERRKREKEQAEQSFKISKTEYGKQLDLRDRKENRPSMESSLTSEIGKRTDRVWKAALPSY
jgi:hypothetical protein